MTDTTYIEALVARAREPGRYDIFVYELADAFEAQQAVVERLREDMMDAVEGLGVRPMYYNGLHRAWLNQTNVDVKTFKTAEECTAWCAETNRRFGNEGLEQTGNHISAQLEAQQTVVEGMRTIKEQEGKVCDAYETCSHPACQSSYRAWAIADAALAALDAEPGGEG